MVLAELGADVDEGGAVPRGRRLAAAGPKVNGESYPFGMPNRSKRSLAWTSRPSAAATCSSGSPRESDLVIENFRPGVVRPPRHRLRRGPRRSRPDILYCSISGFGQTGPYRDRPGFDIMAQGMAGSCG